MEYPTLPSFKLDGKNALITGAGRGIGMGASIALAESGANVTLVSRTENELKNLTKHINALGFKASYKTLDVNNEKEVEQLINDSNPFDILINNAGTNKPAKLIDTNLEDFDHVSTPVAAPIAAHVAAPIAIIETHLEMIDNSDLEITSPDFKRLKRSDEEEDTDEVVPVEI